MTKLYLSSSGIALWMNCKKKNRVIDKRFHRIESFFVRNYGKRVTFNYRVLLVGGGLNFLIRIYLLSMMLLSILIP